MRLLPKKQVAIEASKQKKALIDEGVGLATKVDALRETLVKEEGKVSLFRRETISQVQKEINSAIKERDALHKEIQALTKERVLLQMPLDEEWDKLKASYLAYADQVGALDSTKAIVAKQVGENTLKAQELSIEQDRIAEMKRMTEDKLVAADEKLQRATSESTKMHSLAQDLLASAELREKIVVGREKNLTATWEWIEKEKARFAEKEKELVTREEILKDRTTMLERDIKRLQK